MDKIDEWMDWILRHTVELDNSNTQIPSYAIASKDSALYTYIFHSLNFLSMIFSISLSLRPLLILFLPFELDITSSSRITHRDFAQS